MAHRTLILLSLSAIVGTATIPIIPGDAFAKKAVAASKAAARGPVVVPHSNIPADRGPRCFDSLIRYPSPPCY